VLFSADKYKEFAKAPALSSPPTAPFRSIPPQQLASSKPIILQHTMLMFGLPAAVPQANNSPATALATSPGVLLVVPSLPKVNSM
jgi:hypothetical protein